MSRSITDRCLALAGVMQSADLVQKIAHEGQAPSSEIACSLRSLFVIDAKSTAEVYGGVEQVRSGLLALQTRLSGASKGAEMEATGYTITLLHLQRKLMHNPPLLGQMSERIEKIMAQAEFFSPTHENVIAALADLYQSTISTLNPRIMVKGNEAILNDPNKANLIRALLLAGIRSAILWGQSGGGRLQLFFKRKLLLEAATSLLSSTRDTSTE